MVNACPVPSPEERKAAEILDRAQRAMMEEVHAAVAKAAEQVRDEIFAAGLDLAPAPKAYFDSMVHQRMYLTICGATGGTFQGGDIRTAIGLIRNQQMIANRYWGADIAVTPKAQ